MTAKQIVAELRMVRSSGWLYALADRIEAEGCTCGIHDPECACYRSGLRDGQAHPQAGPMTATEEALATARREVNGLREELRVARLASELYKTDADEARGEAIARLMARVTELEVELQAQDKRGSDLYVEAAKRRDEYKARVRELEGLLTPCAINFFYPAGSEGQRIIEDVFRQLRRRAGLDKAAPTYSAPPARKCPECQAEVKAVYATEGGHPICPNCFATMGPRANGALVEPPKPRPVVWRCARCGSAATDTTGQWTQPHCNVCGSVMTRGRFVPDEEAKP